MISLFYNTFLPEISPDFRLLQLDCHLTEFPDIVRDLAITVAITETEDEQTPQRPEVRGQRSETRRVTEFLARSATVTAHGCVRACLRACVLACVRAW